MKEKINMNFGYLKCLNTGINYFLKRTRLPAGRIISLTVETTNVCNLKCIYCPQSDEDNHFINGKGFMKFETYKTILENVLKDFTPKFVSLHRDGEPLLNKNLEKFISYTVSKGIKTGTTSNCTLIPPERAQRLIASGMSFIKTDFCEDKDTFERLRVGANWEKTYDGMINLLSEAKKSGKPFQMNITDISTHAVSTEIAKNNISKLRNLFHEFREIVYITSVFFHNALGESTTNMLSEQDRAYNGQYNLCHHPWVHIVVDFQGNVVPCCRDLRSEHICGNLIEERMKDIWNGDRLMSVRKALKDKEPEKIDICSKCDLPYRGSYAGKTFVAKTSKLFFSKFMDR